MVPAFKNFSRAFSCFSSFDRLEFLGNMISFFAALFAVIERDYGSIDPGVVGLSLSYAMSITQVGRGKSMKRRWT